MRIAEINMVHYGSTGKIMLGIAECLHANRDDVVTFSAKYYVRSRQKRKEFPSLKEHRYFGHVEENMLHIILSRMSGFQGVYSYFGTRQLVNFLKEYNPDVIHLHNLHNWTVNLPILFHYIKKNKIPVVWTLHDCWSFTGQCPHFILAGCEKWKTGCHHCPQYNKVYPQMYIDQTRAMWKLKRKWFTGVESMTIVTPSQWLAGLVKESFLQDYPVKVIHNGIDLTIFKPTESDFFQKYQIGNKHIVLGVAFGWGKRKGLDVFEELSIRLPDNYQIVLVGTDDNTDRNLPKNIISIHRTNNQQELAEIYSAADVFANPTREENYPTVNMEALACGTPVITFNTGGSPEIIDKSCGIVVDCDDVDAMEQVIRSVCESTPFSEEACLKRAKNFDMNQRFEEYIRLYHDVYKEK